MANKQHLEQPNIQKLTRDTAKRGIYAALLSNLLLLLLLIFLSVYQLYFSMQEYDEQNHLEAILEQNFSIISEIKQSQINIKKFIDTEAAAFDRRLKALQNKIDEQNNSFNTTQLDVLQPKAAKYRHQMMVKLKTMMHMRNLISAHQSFILEVEVLKKIDEKLYDELMHDSDKLLSRSKILQNLQVLKDRFHYKHRHNTSSIISFVLEDFTNIIKFENRSDYEKRKRNVRFIDSAKELIRANNIEQGLLALKNIDSEQDKILLSSITDLRIRAEMLRILNNQIEIILENVN